MKNLIEEFKYYLKNPSRDEISTVLIEELDLIEEYIINTKQGSQKEESIYKKEIKMKYMDEEGVIQQIFGYQFVQNNINNIYLIINGNKSPLVQEYFLKEGENDITLCIKNKLINLSNMFDYCKTLYNIDKLKYLNNEYVFYFSGMFQSSNISNIKALKNWNTSKSETFRAMFYYYGFLTNIKPLKIWNVSRCKVFSEIFKGCPISNLKPLESWNVPNAKNLKALFSGLKNIVDISPIQNWNGSNCENLSDLFSSCEKLSDITPIEN